MPCLIAYARATPGFRFDLRVEADLVDMARHSIDLRVGYGAGHYPDHQVLPLAQDHVLPMCSPEYLQRHPEIGEGWLDRVLPGDLLHTSWGPSFGSNPSWRAWFHMAGLVAPPDAAGFQIGRSGLVLDMARAGMGVALAQRMLARADLAAGRLVVLSDQSLALGHPYVLAFPRSKARKPDLQTLCAWLIQSAEGAVLP